MKRSILSVLLGLALSIVGFLLAARYIKEPPSVTTYWPIPAALVAMLVVWLLQGAVIALLSWPRLKSVKLLDMTRVYLATQSAGAMTPFAGGEVAYQFLELYRRGLPADDTGAVIAIRAILNGVVLIPAAAVGILFVPHVPFVGSASNLPFSARKVLIGAALALSVTGAVVIAFLAYLRESGGEDSGGWREKIFAKLSDWRAKVLDYLRHLKNSLAWIWRQEPRVVIACLGMIVLYWTLYPLLGTLALRAAGWDGGGWIHVYVAQYVLFIVIPLAPTPGNSGAAELAFVALMDDYVPHSALLGGVIIWRALTHYSELMVGAFIAGRGLPEDIKVAKREFGSG